MGELEPEIRAADLAADVAQNRLEAARLHGAADAEWQPRIDAHLDVYDEIVETLVGHHRDIADRTDIEIGADTRWSAIWEMGGRCLAISRVLLHDMRGGFCSESDGTLRALHEAVQLLSALSFYREDEAVRRWLAGDWVRPAEVREIQARQQELAIERMREAGIEPEGGDVAELGRQIYGAMSESTHHRRGGFPESISVPLRRFAYGPHPDAERRAAHLAFAGELLEEVVLVVGSALGEVIGGTVWQDIIRPRQARMERVRETHPLP